MIEKLYDTGSLRQYLLCGFAVPLISWYREAKSGLHIYILTSNSIYLTQRFQYDTTSHLQNRDRVLIGHLLNALQRWFRLFYGNRITQTLYFPVCKGSAVTASLLTIQSLHLWLSALLAYKWHHKNILLSPLRLPYPLVKKKQNTSCWVH